jgi:hypothetical protein
MMRADIANAVSIGAISLLLAASGMAAPAAKLSPDEIKATFFNGQPFTASTPANVKFKMTFTADGKMKRQPVGGGKNGGTGTWKLSSDGFCRTWKGAKEECFTIVSAGTNQWSVLKGSGIVATWSK